MENISTKAQIAKLVAESRWRQHRQTLSLIAVIFLALATAGSAFGNTEDAKAQDNLAQGIDPNTIYLPAIINNTPVAAKPFPEVPDVPYPPTDVYAGCTVVETQSTRRYDQANLTVKRKYTTTYSDMSLPVDILYDDGGDGTVEIETKKNYGTGGKLIDSVKKRMPSGIVLSTHHTVYDSALNPIHHIYDDDGDGKTDSTITLAYDGEGHLVQETIDVTDPNQGDLIITFGWDNDQFTRKSYDSDTDGKPDYGYINTWQNGTPTETYFWRGQVSESTLIDRYLYDPEGRLSIWRSYNTSGDINGSISYSYGDNGSIAKENVWIPGIEVTDTYSYNDEGRLEQLVSSGGGFVDQSVFENNCP